MKFAACVVCLVLAILTSVAAVNGNTNFNSYSTNLIPVLTIHDTTYSNVLVREVQPFSITIVHAGGLASFNPDNLTDEQKEKLGLYVFVPEPPSGPRLPTFDQTSNTLFRLQEDYVPVQWQNLSREQVRDFLTENRRVWVPALIGGVIFYLFVCLCFGLICAKAGKPSPLLVWIPIVQIFPLIRAARMSPVWFVLVLLYLLLPVAILGTARGGSLPDQMLGPYGIIFALLSLLNLIGWIVWSFKICRARGKNMLLGLFLLLPVTNVLALIYLAFSKAENAPRPI